MDMIREAVPVHKVLGEETNAPNGWNTADLADEYELDFKMKNKRLVFEFTKVPPPTSGHTPGPGPAPRPGKKTRALDLKIDKECWVDISLRSDHARWAVQDAITIGEDHQDSYFILEYYVNGAWKRKYENKHWVQDPADVPCRRIRFGVRKRLETEKRDTPVNFNVDLEDDRGEFLPISIDPDIRNPGTRP